MSKFHKVIEVGSCFKSTNINVWYPELFNFGSDVESTIFSYQYVPNNGRAQVTIDVFKYRLLNVSISSLVLLVDGSITIK